MRKTPIDLYRMGNATSSRIDNIRSKDIETYEEDSDIWVVAGSGGNDPWLKEGDRRLLREGDRLSYISTVQYNFILLR